MFQKIVVVSRNKDFLYSNNDGAKSMLDNIADALVQNKRVITWGSLSGLICLSADLSLELCLEHTEVQGQKH